jgi:hypothetical protein
MMTGRYERQAKQAGMTGVQAQQAGQVQLAGQA